MKLTSNEGDRHRRPRRNRWLASAGWGWVVFGLYLTFLALASAGLGLNVFPVFLPWIAAAEIVGAAVLIRPNSLRVASISVLAGLASLVAGLWVLTTSSPGFLASLGLVVSGSVGITVLSKIGLIRALRSKVV